MGISEKRRKYIQEYQRNWLQKRRLAWFSRNGPCKNCGSKENLCLHHDDSSLKEDHKIWSWSDSRREAELKKCYVLCRLCHSKIHAPDRASLRGEENPMSTVSTETVLLIRKLYSENIRQVDICKQLKVSRYLVWKVVHRKKWKHLP